MKDETRQAKKTQTRFESRPLPTANDQLTTNNEQLTTDH